MGAHRGNRPAFPRSDPARPTDIFRSMFMGNHTRRRFLELTSITAVSSVSLLGKASANAMTAPPEETAAKTFPFALGMTSYTFRSFTLDQVISMTNRLGLKKLGIKDMHLP